jgi:polypeptide N-acetylgalactosaminyltransferase
LKNLPLTSVIVIFYDEPWSLILRCLHSIYNRTPHDVLKEMILVNDKSNDTELGPRIEKYAKENFGDKVKYFMNSERKGLIVTRMEGARRALGEVIVFLDSHMEVNVNWLPPLVEPIVLNRKTATVPIIDSISPFTLEYQSLGQGSRGSFDWTLTYQWLPLTKDYQNEPGDNYQLSAMTGGAYAINREYFFELGGYDEGMVVWNGENYELSFKLHLCGGNLIQIPCSHVAHTTKHRMAYREVNYNVDFSARNLKRVAEVWMDEYKEALYRTDPKRYALDPGDLTKALKLKNDLNCKPFKFYLEVIAPDLVDRYPPVPMSNFASGTIMSEADPSMCVSFVGKLTTDPLQLRKCDESPSNPREPQNFALTWHRAIVYRVNKDPLCVDAQDVNMYVCHYNFGNQLWKYDWVRESAAFLPQTILNGNLCATGNSSTHKSTEKHLHHF